MKRIVAVLLGGLMLVVAGCTPQPEAPRTEMIIGATAQPPSMDPTTSDSAAIPQVLLYNVYETLIKIDNDGQMQPLLATQWALSEDRLSYTFSLDERATFADGRPVTAQDVVWNIERVRTEGTAVLKNQMAPVKKATATGERTVRVELSKQSNSWLYWMSSTAGMIIDPKASDLTAKPAGTGPYTLTSWSKGSDLVLSQRDTYWGAKPYATKVTFRYFSDPNAMNASMLSGGLDVISNLQAPQALAQFADTAQFQVIEGTTQGEVVMGFNHQTPALKDKRIRQAINHAIDREALLKTVWGGKGTLIGSMVPPTDPWYEDLSNTYPYDPEKARQLIAESGQSNITLRLRVPTLPYATASAQFIASQLGEVGIKVVIDELEFPARWLDLVLAKADYDMTIVAHVEARDIVKWGDPQYYWRYDNPEVRKLLASADSGTEAEQVTDMKKAGKLLADDAVADFLFLMPNLVIAKPDITGIPPNASTLSFDLTRISRG
ncbi:MAG: ABC transporter substrate-binding protein [Propionibacteriales bacterium]|nr:ABC transporter substrate-binding protein [Propionibacteriales bacterium]